MSRIQVVLFSNIVLFFSSCITHDKMLLIQGGASTSKIDSIQNQVNMEYQLQEGDLIDIRVSSLDPQSVAIFNKTVGGNLTPQISEASMYLNGYEINRFGNINVPLIGDVQVKGITIDSLNNVLDQKLKGYFKYYTVAARLVNYRLSVLGEVSRPGVQYVYNNNTTVLQAIAGAGGLGTFGNSKRVKVVRKENGKVKVMKLDLSKDDIINSEFYYIKPNDLIYVEPVKAKAVSQNIPLWSLLISTVSLSILILSSVRNN